ALYAARRWFRTTRSMASRLASYRRNGPTSDAISADAAYDPACMMAVSAPHWARPSAESYGMPWTISRAPRLAYPRPRVRKSNDFRATDWLGNGAVYTLISRIRVQTRMACWY